MHDSLDDLKPAAVEAPLSTPSEMTTATVPLKYCSTPLPCVRTVTLSMQNEAYYVTVFMRDSIIML